MHTTLFMFSQHLVMLTHVLSFPFVNKWEHHCLSRMRKQIQRGEALAPGHTAGNWQSCGEGNNTPKLTFGKWEEIRSVNS